MKKYYVIILDDERVCYFEPERLISGKLSEHQDQLTKSKKLAVSLCKILNKLYPGYTYKVKEVIFKDLP